MANQELPKFLAHILPAVAKAARIFRDVCTVPNLPDYDEESSDKRALHGMELARIPVQSEEPTPSRGYHR